MAWAIDAHALSNAEPIMLKVAQVDMTMAPFVHILNGVSHPTAASIAPSKRPQISSSFGSAGAQAPPAEAKSRFAHIRRSFAEMFERDLDTLIVHSLEVGLELVAPLGAARE